MRRLLSLCEDFALEYNIKFNAKTSKLLVCPPRKRNKISNQLIKRDCMLFIDGKLIERVQSFSHLVHIITADLNDSDDILHRRNCFVGQANNIMCFFSKLDRMVRSKLLSTYCSSRYECELWLLDNSDINVFGTAWRKAARRVLKLPPDTHNSLIPLLLNALPFFDNICKRSARFIIFCLQSNVSLVRFVARFGVFVNRCTSPLGRNIQYCCSNFNWNFERFVNGDISMSNKVFVKLFYSSVSEIDWLTVDALRQMLNLRDGFDFLFFFDGSTLLHFELDSLILYLASSRTL